MPIPNVTPVARAAAKAAQASAARDDAIRKVYAEGFVTIRKLAEAAGLSPARVHQIIHGR